MSRACGVHVIRFFLFFTLGLLLAGSNSAAQVPPPQAPPSSQQTGDETPQGPTEPNNAKPAPNSKSDAQSGKEAETKITPQQAEELFRDVDTILDFASKDSGLPKKRDVKRLLATRDEVVSYLKKNMAEDKDVQRL